MSMNRCQCCSSQQTESFIQKGNPRNCIQSSISWLHCLLSPQIYPTSVSKRWEAHLLRIWPKLQTPMLLEVKVCFNSHFLRWSLDLRWRYKCVATKLHFALLFVFCPFWRLQLLVGKCWSNRFWKRIVLCAQKRRRGGQRRRGHF